MSCTRPGPKLAAAPRQQVAGDGDDQQAEGEHGDDAGGAEVLAGDGKDDGGARRAGHEADQHRRNHALAPGGKPRRARDRRHVATQAEQEGHGNAAVQADAVEAAIDDEGDALHQAHLLQADQQHHQRDHVGQDDAGEADQAVHHGAADHAAGRNGAPVGDGLGQLHRGQRVDPAADLEDHEQHGGEYGEAADQAPARMQEQLVEPVAPAVGARHAHAQRRLGQGGGAMVPVGMQFLGQRPRQQAAGGLAQRHQFGQQLGKMLAEFRLDETVAGGELEQQPLVRHAEGGVHVVAIERRRQRLQAFGDMRARRLRQRTTGAARACRRALEQFRQALPHQRHGGHHRQAHGMFQGLDIDLQAGGQRLVHPVQRHHHRPSQAAEFQGQLKMRLQPAGIDHLDDQVGRRKRHRRRAGLMHRYRRALVAPEQVLEGVGIVAGMMLQCVQGGQFDQAGLVEADLHRAFAIHAVRAGQLAAARRGARHGIEQGGLAGAGQPGQGQAQAPLAAKQRRAQRHRRHAVTFTFHFSRFTACIRAAGAPAGALPA
jgi:hypothetical protein